MIQPLGTKILIDLGETGKEKTTQSGLIIAVSNRDNEAAQTGKVAAKGELVSEAIEVGANLLFAKYSGERLEDNGRDYVIIEEDDAIAIYEEEETESTD